MYKHFIKRLLDIIISLLVLIILAPVLLITAIAVKVTSPGPIIFRQRRLGLGGKEFIGVKNLFVEVPKFEPQVAA